MVLERKYIMHMFNENNIEVCTIEVTDGINRQQAKLKVIHEDKLPLDFYIGVRDSETVILRLKDRVLPPERMFLKERLAPYGIDPNDWIGKIKLNKGMTYSDNFYIEVEDL